MALLKYKSTRETTNLARVARTILGPCTDVLRDVLAKEVPQLTLSQKVKTYLARLPNHKKCPITKHQQNIIDSGDYKDFDITLLVFLLRNVSQIPPHKKQWGNEPHSGDRSVSANIERIRIIRNEHYGHANEIDLSDTAFEKIWKSILKIVKELESYIGTSTKYQDALVDLKTCHMDPDAQNHDINCVLQQQQDEISILKRNMEHMKKITSVRHLESEHDKKKFEQWQEEDKFFISTKACNEIEKLIKKQNFVIVTGNSGSGKSAIIQHIALKYRNQDWFVKLAFSVQEILELNSSVQNKTIIVLQDPIGKESLDELVYNAWENHKDTLRNVMKNGRILLSCRKYILSDNRITGIFKEKSNIVDINDDQFKLSNEEKEKIWNIHSCNKKLSNEEFAKIIDVNEYFPLLCKLFTSKRTPCGEIVSFFTKPKVVVIEEIRSIRDTCKEKYCALILLALLNKVSTDDLQTNSKSKEKLKIALKIGGLHPNTETNIIVCALETLKGYFVKKIANFFYFYHDFLMEVTTFVFGTDYPTDAIKYADVRFLRKRLRIRSKDVHNDQFTIYISDTENEQIDSLGKRLFDELFNKRFLHVVQHPCLRNRNVANVLKREFEAVPEKLKLLLVKKKLPTGKREEVKRTENGYLTKLSFLTCNKEISRLCALIVYSHPDLSLHCLKTLKQSHIDLRGHFLFSSVCCNGSLDLFNIFRDRLEDFLTEKWGCLHPIHIVCLFQNVKLLQQLILWQVDVNLLIKEINWTPLMLAAVNDIRDDEVNNEENSSDTMHNNTVQCLLDNNANINFNGMHGASPLYVACENGNYRTVYILLQNGAHTNSCIEDGISPLLIASKKGYDSIVQTLLQNGTNINVCDHNDASPLFIASQKGYGSIVQLLLSREEANINLFNRTRATSLFIACQNGHASIVQLLMKRGADINFCDTNGASPLFIACKNGHASIVELLLKGGADINLCDKNGDSSLFIACKYGHPSLVEVLLSREETDINLCNRIGASSLFIACEYGHVSIVELLLKYGPNINLCNGNGASSLLIACQSGHITTVQLLLNHRVEINLCDKNDVSPLHKASENGHIDIVQLLLSNNADINLCTKKEVSPLFIACQNGHDRTIDVLLRNGASINFCDENGASPLYTACKNGLENTTQILLNNRADINLCDRNGASPLFIACHNGYDNTVQLLVRNRAHIDLCEENGISPLYIACKYGHQSIVQFLLKSGANINLCDKKRVSPLFIACEYGHDSTVELLLSKGAKINLCEINEMTPLSIACLYGHDNIVKLLLCYGADINSCKKDIANPLYVACYYGHHSTVKLLLDNEINIEFNENLGVSPFRAAVYMEHYNIAELLLSRGEETNSLLYLACQNGYDRIVQFLLLQGVDINLCDENGYSPLFLACQNGQESIVHFLLEKKADIYNRMGNKSTPLHIACQNGYDSIVQFLLSQDVDINVCDDHGYSPLFLACQNGQKSIVQHLLSRGAKVNLCTENGISPLFIACQNGFKGTVQLLIKGGAAINLCDKNRVSPVNIAKEKGHESIVKLLHSNGATNRLCENDCDIPFHIDSQNGHESAV